LFFPIESGVGCARETDRQTDRAHAREKAQSFENEMKVYSQPGRQNMVEKMVCCTPGWETSSEKKTFAELVDMDIAQL
jgi:hypothetical protein